MLAPPGLPKDISNLPRLPLGNFSYTKVGDMLERGRLLGSTRLATGLPASSRGVKLKSVISLLSKKPPAKPLPRFTISLEPNCDSMVVVIAKALPYLSTMLMWDVPYSF